MSDYFKKSDAKAQVQINREKAFDSIEWSFIEKTLRHFNFGTSLVSWVKLFYTNISSCVLNNGWASDFFSLHRGVRQGCPLSPYLFILGAEILGNAVRRDTEIRGIKSVSYTHLTLPTKRIV